MLTEMKNHVEAWIHSLNLSIDHEWHKGVTNFVSFAEGRQAELDAIDLLTSKGYTVTKAS
jgi:hypothetical protein